MSKGNKRIHFDRSGLLFINFLNINKKEDLTAIYSHRKNHFRFQLSSLLAPSGVPLISGQLLNPRDEILVTYL